MAALLELVHGSHPHLHFHLLHLARLLCRPTQLNLKLHPNASPIELLSTAVLLHLVRLLRRLTQPNFKLTRNFIHVHLKLPMPELELPRHIC